MHNIPAEEAIGNLPGYGFRAWSRGNARLNMLWSITPSKSQRK